MIRFDSDYTEGAHQRIIDALVRTNMEQTVGYGLDEHCDRARKLIKRECGRDDLHVHFLVGGTQTNETVIASILRPFQGVLCADTGHIAQHETGAIESTGHKVLTLASRDGKINADQIKRAYREHWENNDHEHIVQPGMVYISQPTEYGTLYSLEELREIYSVCLDFSLPLFIDGARLGYAMAADEALSLKALSELCDVFSIGGTKVGMLFGEAVVFCRQELRANFRYMMKQRGGMLAKGRLLGIQFETMFEDGLYYAVSASAIEKARMIKASLEEKGIPQLFDSPTNQLFPILTKAQQQKLAESFVLSHWEKADGGRDVMRICTSWATTEENASALCRAISQL